MVATSSYGSCASRSRGAIYGLYIGDALAMPVHWYYDRSALRRDYGTVEDYLSPKNPHPDSILWRSSYTPLDERGEILHDQAQYWGRRGIHYHQFLEAGENTLNLKLCTLLIESLNQNGDYDAEDYLSRYIRFMTTPGNHRDTYVEDSVPATIYLALKYHEDPEKGLIANTNLGGDNVHRGAVLGALLGAGNGLEAFPKRWIKGLRHPPPEFIMKGKSQEDGASRGSEQI